MLDSIYHMTLKLLKNAFLDIFYATLTLHFEICKPLVVYRFCCMALYHSQRRHMIMCENGFLVTRIVNLLSFRDCLQANLIMECCWNHLND